MELQSPEIKDLAAALAKAQKSIKPAIKDSDNPFYKSKYADLAAVKAAADPYLTEHGLSVVQALNYANGETLLVSTLLHTSGQWVRSIVPVKPVKPDPQGLGSAITYMRRYSYAALVGVATEDDDGNGASSSQRSAADHKTAGTFSMAYDDEQNKEAYEQAIKTISGFSAIEDLEKYWKANKNRLNKLPKELFDDVIAACSQQKTDIGNKQLNGAH